ncbi:MAG: helix-turn-helix transcriptional regulator [Erysipelotrichaceae bacterium]|nr:helix-turn-helix transcriptional regulator [Erysipelotrichaceae bacterium]
MNNKAIRLEIKEKTKFELTFIDGKVLAFDSFDLMTINPKVVSLIDRELFKKGKLQDDNKIVWPKNIKLNVKDIYDEGTEVRNEENIFEIILGYQIRKARTSKKITQANFSKIVNIDQADLSKIENGKLSPSLTTLKRIAKGLDLNLNIELTNK